MSVDALPFIVVLSALVRAAPEGGSYHQSSAGRRSVAAARRRPSIILDRSGDSADGNVRDEETTWLSG
ncbi:MAG: hypothetical protein QF634_16770 [Vicinamibacterales bacterium]|jgi:hypothetical protein|nr:hypothetical protein [Vicinamibacterales bacterium]